MKYLMVLYGLYFSFLMIVPSNHAGTHFVEDLLGLDLHSYCNHQHSEKDDSKESHHHTCTHFCGCGAVHFVVVSPPTHRWFCVSREKFFTPTFFDEPTKIWANLNEFGRLVIAEIWHPPHF